MRLLIPCLQRSNCGCPCCSHCLQAWPQIAAEPECTWTQGLITLQKHYHTAPSITSATMGSPVSCCICRPPLLLSQTTPRLQYVYLALALGLACSIEPSVVICLCKCFNTLLRIVFADQGLPHNWDPYGRMARRRLQTAGLDTGDIIIVQWNGAGTVQANSGNFAFL